MILRALTVVGALAGGAGMSQFPEYTQQYGQRLAGAVDEMRIVVANFDRALADLGQTRDDAFAPGQDLSPREGQMLDLAQGNIDRLAFLEAALAQISDASVLQRLVQIPSLADRDIAARAYGDFKPAMPLTVEGLACAGLGFVAGWLVVGMSLSLLTFPFRSRQDATA